MFVLFFLDFYEIDRTWRSTKYGHALDMFRLLKIEPNHQSYKKQSNSNMEEKKIEIISYEQKTRVILSSFLHATLFLHHPTLSHSFSLYILNQKLHCLTELPGFP
jgi:hypothetical protein